MVADHWNVCLQSAPWGTPQMSWLFEACEMSFWLKHFTQRIPALLAPKAVVDPRNTDLV